MADEKVTIGQLAAYLEEIAPLHYQEDYDNAGLIVGDPQDAITGVLVSLDTTEAIVEEAILHGCNMIVAHHPIVFRGLKKITGKTYVERVIIKAIRAKIAIYAIHTNLDNVLSQGVNQRIAQRLGLEDLQILVPKLPGVAHVGAGIVGTWPTPKEERFALEWVKEKMQAGCLRHTQYLGRPIRRVAVCGGAGSFLLPHAIKAQADLFITADYKYHEFFDADNHLIIADIGHYESEQFTISLLYDIISKKYSNFAVRSTKLVTNPVYYL